METMKGGGGSEIRTDKRVGEQRKVHFLKPNLETIFLTLSPTPSREHGRVTIWGMRGPGKTGRRGEDGGGTWPGNNGCLLVIPVVWYAN